MVSLHGENGRENGVASFFKRKNEETPSPHHFPQDWKEQKNRLQRKRTPSLPGNGGQLENPRAHQPLSGGIHESAIRSTAGFHLLPLPLAVGAHRGPRRCQADQKNGTGR